MSHNIRRKTFGFQFVQKIGTEQVLAPMVCVFEEPQVDENPAIF